MNHQTFIATDLALRINDCKERLFTLYSSNGYNDEISAVQDLLSGISHNEMIRVTFVGQYTAGKSTIISALTKNNHIRIDSDIATDEAADYILSDSVILTDTPGLYTENPEHSQRTIEMIRQSDLLVYCITSDLFNPYTKDDFQRWAFEIGYHGKMFLVINKMSKESGDYPVLRENYTNTINRSLSPHSIDEFPYSFIDAKDYRDGIKDNDNDLIAFSHFEDFIAQLNSFILQKGQLGKLDTPIKVLKSSIDRISELSVDDAQDRAYFSLLSRIEKRVDQSRSQAHADIHSCIRRGLRPIADKGFELSRSIGIENVDFTEDELNELIESTCEELNASLTRISEDNVQRLNSDIADIMESDTAVFFFNAVSGSVTGKKHLFENKKTKISRAQFEAMNEVVTMITGKTIPLATKGGQASSGFLIKSSEAAGSKLHTAVKYIGGKLGVKFKPWQAANIAKGIGNVAKFAGPLLSVIGFIFDVKDTIDEAERSQKIIEAQVEYRKQFTDIVEALELEYVKNVSGLFDVYETISSEIVEQRNNVQQVIANNDAMTKELASLKSELTEIQGEIF